MMKFIRMSMTILCMKLMQWHLLTATTNNCEELLGLCTSAEHWSLTVHHPSQPLRENLLCACYFGTGWTRV